MRKFNFTIWQHFFNISYSIHWLSFKEVFCPLYFVIIFLESLSSRILNKKSTDKIRGKLFYEKVQFILV